MDEEAVDEVLVARAPQTIMVALLPASALRVRE